MELTQGDEAGKLSVEELLQLVVLQVEHLRSSQAFEAEGADGDNLAVVEKDLGNMTTSDKAGPYQLRHVVAIEEDLSGVHGNKSGHVGVVPAGALDLVHRPLGVVEAGASVGALHAAVAGKEVAAEAVGLAVSRVLAEQIRRWNGDKGEASGGADYRVEITDSRAHSTRYARPPCRSSHPRERAVAGPWVVCQQEPRPVGRGHRGQGKAGERVALEINQSQSVQPEEALLRDVGDAVVVHVDVSEVGEQAAGLQDLDVIEARIKRVQTVASLEPEQRG